MTTPWLSLLIWLPMMGGILLLFLKDKPNTLIPKAFALLIALSCLFLCFPLLAGFDSQDWNMQFKEHISWIPKLHIYYALGIDGFSLPLILLTCFMGLIIVLASIYSVKNAVSQYLAAFLIMQGLICGVFAATDAVLFYSFWEAMLIPMFLIIGLWGGKNRIYATMKFFLYTFLGSVLLLIAIIYLQVVAKSVSTIELDSVFNISTFHQLPLTLFQQKCLFWAFLIAFAVKIPMWPVHTWLPDAHVEAPTGGSVILAAVLLKMGGYGIIRFILPIVPDANQVFATLMITLSLVAILYIALIAIVQQDMKKLIAYSSISHMGFVTLGLFIVYGIIKTQEASFETPMGIEGAMVQMISHGFVSAALFLCIGVLYDRLHSRLIKDYGGVASVMPIFSAFFMFFAMANIGLPGTSGFVGEFLVILSTFRAQPMIAFLTASILVLGATYTLWMYKRVILGPIEHEKILKLFDLKSSEKWMLIILALAVLGLGLWPQPLLNMMSASSNHLLLQMLSSKL